MKKNFLVLCLLLSTLIQAQKIIKYYDSLWMPTSVQTAFYFSEFEKRDTSYDVRSYWNNSKKLYCKSSFTDTLFTKAIGSLVRYYKTGQIEDSFHYDKNGLLINALNYYPDGELRARYSYDQNSKTERQEGFYENGKPIPNYIFFKEAAFPGDNNAWVIFLNNNLNTKIPIRRGAPNGIYPVVITFVVDKNGDIIKISPETDFGYGMEEEAIRVIKKSPKWSPLIYYGKLENAYRKQPFTFIVK